MRWPWISRLAYDTLVDERDWLRAQNDELKDQIIRIARREHKMPEVGPKPDQRKGEEPIPGFVEDVIQQWDNPHHQEMARSRARQLKRELKTWEAVRDALLADATG